MFEFSLIALFIIVLIIVALAGFFFWGLKHAVMLAINSVIGFFALYAVQAFLIPTLVISFWSVLFVAIGGLIGLILVLLLHALGWAF